MVVTVLMSVYNPPLEMLNTAIGSIRSQTFRDFEFLILNDGSTDENARLNLDLWASRDARLRVLHEPHLGLTRTLNRGLTIAQGEFVARQDADDWSEPERLARQVAYLCEHPRLALVGAGTYSHCADGNPLWRLRLPHTHEELSRAFWKGNPMVHGAAMFRRTLALSIGGYREQFPCSQDYDFFWRLMEAGGAVNLDEVLYHYRYTSGAVSARKASDQARVHRAAQALAIARQKGEIEDIQAALAAAAEETVSDAFRASLKQADHLMLAGDFPKALTAYARLLHSRPLSGLAWAKMFRLAVFAAIPPIREVCFR